VSTALRNLRVGRLPYLNVRPFHGGWSGDEPRWVEGTPRRLGELAAMGRLDAAPLASRDALALRDRFRPLADLGIACSGTVGSVLLLSRLPIRDLSGRAIALTGESRTSRALLRILLSDRFSLSGQVYVPGEAEALARLCIGDEALVARGQRRWPHALDLGAAWTEWTGLPFVYARWVVRRDVEKSAASALAEALARSLRWPCSLDPIHLPEGYDPSRARRYLARFVYRLGADEERGLRRFHQELVKHGLLDPPRDSHPLWSAA
jgi:chorismate dehydratase